MSTNHDFGVSPPPATSRGRTTRIVAVVVALAVVGGIGGFLVLRKGTPVFAEPPRDVPRMDGKWIRYSAAFAARSKLEFGLPESAGLTPVVNVTGTVTFDPGARRRGRRAHLRSRAQDRQVPRRPGEGR